MKPNSTPEQKARNAEWMREYRKRPEVREREAKAAALSRAQNPEIFRTRTREYMRRTRQDNKGGKVYFLQIPSGPIKIGFTSKKPEGRLAELQAGNHETLTLLHWIPGTKELEKELHHRFLHLLLRSEWFRPGPDLLEFLKTLSVTTQL